MMRKMVHVSLHIPPILAISETHLIQTKKFTDAHFMRDSVTENNPARKKKFSNI